MMIYDTGLRKPHTPTSLKETIERVVRDTNPDRIKIQGSGNELLIASERHGPDATMVLAGQYIDVLTNLKCPAIGVMLIGPTGATMFQSDIRIDYDQVDNHVSESDDKLMSYDAIANNIMMILGEHGECSFDDIHAMLTEIHKKSSDTYGLAVSEIRYTLNRLLVSEDIEIVPNTIGDSIYRLPLYSYKAGGSDVAEHIRFMQEYLTDYKVLPSEFLGPDPSSLLEVRIYDYMSQMTEHQYSWYRSIILYPGMNGMVGIWARKNCTHMSNVFKIVVKAYLSSIARHCAGNIKEPCDVSERLNGEIYRMLDIVNGYPTDPLEYPSHSRHQYLYAMIGRIVDIINAPLTTTMEVTNLTPYEDKLRNDLMTFTDEALEDFKNTVVEYHLNYANSKYSPVLVPKYGPDEPKGSAFDMNISRYACERMRRVPTDKVRDELTQLSLSLKSALHSATTDDLVANLLALPTKRSVHDLPTDKVNVGDRYLVGDRLVNICHSGTLSKEGVAGLSDFDLVCYHYTEGNVWEVLYTLRFDMDINQYRLLTPTVPESPQEKSPPTCLLHPIINLLGRVDSKDRLPTCSCKVGDGYLVGMMYNHPVPRSELHKYVLKLYCYTPAGKWELSCDEVNKEEMEQARREALPDEEK